MFSVEFRVNGRLVHCVYGHQAKRLGGGDYSYYYEFYSADPITGEKTRERSGYVKHKRDVAMGLIKLCSAIILKVLKLSGAKEVDD